MSKGISFGLVRMFPFFSKIFRWATPRILDFSSYPIFKGKVLRMERERELALQAKFYEHEIDDRHTQILKLILPKSSEYSLQRVGSRNDGGYLIPPETIFNSNWITIGLGFNCEFENDLVSAGSTVNTFDHTIPWRPKSLDKKVRWFKFGWGSGSQSDCGDLSTIFRKAEYQDDKDWNLKFDIEGSEWALLNQITKGSPGYKLPSLVTCELHNLLWSNNDDKVVEILEQFNIFYLPVYTHGNNFSSVYANKNYVIYDAVEVTWIRRDYSEKYKRSSSTSDSYNFYVNDASTIQLKMFLKV